MRRPDVRPPLSPGRKWWATVQPVPARWRLCLATVLVLVSNLATPAWPQTTSPVGAPPTTPVATPAKPAESTPEAIAPSDIPARADADEQIVQAMVQRALAATASAQRFEPTLQDYASAVQRLAEQSSDSTLALLPPRRLGSLRRHWLLYERNVSRWRSDLQRKTQLISEDAAQLASLRATWQLTRSAATGSAPALIQRAEELTAQIDKAEQAFSAPLAKVLALGRRGSALFSRIQNRSDAVQGVIDRQDRALLTVEAPPLWETASDPGSPATASFGAQESFAMDMAFARDYDASRAAPLRLLIALCVLLLPLMLWFRNRAARLVGSDEETARRVQVLSRPWAAWLVMVALVAVLYDFQGPIIRQQIVMLLAWVPVLYLLPRKVLSVFAPWGYLSAVFYFLNVFTLMLVGNPVVYRSALLTLNIAMLATLVWLLWRARPATAESTPTRREHIIRQLLVTASLMLLVAVGANTLGNLSLAAMLTGTVLESSYLALALYAGATVLVALCRLLLSRPAVSRLRDTTRHTGSLIQATAHVGRTLLVLAWLVFTLQALRVYQPVVDWLVKILTHDVKLGVMTLSVGGIAAFFTAAWLAFWLAKTIRLVLAEDVLPSLSLPRGVRNSISTLTYYTVLFLGLLAALAVAGFQVGQLAIVFGALGVGIGFGLQDVVKNFVAGLILMFERPVQPGDVVEVAGTSGTVREIGMRATIVTTWEGAEVIVPNGMLLADKLVNWTLVKTSRRIDLNISTRPDADPQRTLDLLTSIARAAKGVAVHPAPVAILTGLAPGALDFNLRVWTIERSDFVIVRSDLAVKLRDGLAEAGLDVPLPQRELHLRSVSSAVAESLARASAAPP